MIVPESYLIDSNVLVYAADRSESTKYEKAKAFVLDFAHVGKAFLSIQNLVEFHAAVTLRIEHPISVDESRKIVGDFAQSFKICHYSHITLMKAMQLQVNYGIHFWDALLVATMQENHIRTIYTEDLKDFQKIPGINAINPLL